MCPRDIGKLGCIGLPDMPAGATMYTCPMPTCRGQGGRLAGVEVQGYGTASSGTCQKFLRSSRIPGQTIPTQGFEVFKR